MDDIALARQCSSDVCPQPSLLSLGHCLPKCRDILCSMSQEAGSLHEELEPFAEHCMHACKWGTPCTLWQGSLSPGTTASLPLRHLTAGKTLHRVKLIHLGPAFSFQSQKKKSPPIHHTCRQFLGDQTANEIRNYSPASWGYQRITSRVALPLLPPVTPSFATSHTKLKHALSKALWSKQLKRHGICARACHLSAYRMAMAQEAIPPQSQFQGSNVTQCHIHNVEPINLPSVTYRNVIMCDSQCCGTICNKGCHASCGRWMPTNASMS